METMSVDRLLPCPRCRYDLRGRVVGEQCPECGWTIDAAAPAWWDDALLARMAFWARVAAIPCWVLLLVPLYFVVGVTSRKGADGSGIGGALVRGGGRTNRTQTFIRTKAAQDSARGASRLTERAPGTG